LSNRNPATSGMVSISNTNTLGIDLAKLVIADTALD
jgi:hypothetical protein